jgi:perosamine synthetase
MIPIYRPSIRRREMDAVLSSLVADNLTDGPVGREFLRALTTYLELDAGVLLREYERAIGLAIDALELEEGKGIILSPLSSVLYKQVIEDRGFSVLLADVDADTMTFNVKEVEVLANDPECGAIIADAPCGFIPDLHGIKELGLPVIEDITATFGAHDGTRPCGSYGDVVVLRMEAGDILTVAGGAAVFSSGRKYSQRIRKLVESWPSFRFLTDMNSSLGAAQLKDLEHFFFRRRDVYNIYSDAVRKGRHSTPVQRGEAEQVFNVFPVLLKGGVKDVQAYAKKKGVETVQAYTDSIITFNGLDGREYEGAGQIYRRCLLFPLYPMLSKNEIEMVSKVLSTLP